MLAGFGKGRGAALDCVPFLVELIVRASLGRPLFLLADVVKAPGERARGSSKRSKAIEKSGGRVDPAVLGVEALD